MFEQEDAVNGAREIAKSFEILADILEQDGLKNVNREAALHMQFCVNQYIQELIKEEKAIDCK